MELRPGETGEHTVRDPVAVRLRIHPDQVERIGPDRTASRIRPCRDPDVAGNPDPGRGQGLQRPLADVVVVEEKHLRQPATPSREPRTDLLHRHPLQRVEIGDVRDTDRVALFAPAVAVEAAEEITEVVEKAAEEIVEAAEEVKSETESFFE